MGNQNLNVLEVLVYVILDSVSKMVTVRVTQFLQITKFHLISSTIW